MNDPYTKFYWRDAISDMALHSCSLAARGLWLDMLSIMGISPCRGYLMAGGKAITTAEELAVFIPNNGGVSQLKQLFSELESRNVFYRDDHGRIYSKRMVTDDAKLQEARRLGLIGAARKKEKNHSHPTIRLV